MNKARTIECQVRFRHKNYGRREISPGTPAPPMTLERLPRVARLMALAHRFDAYLRVGVVTDVRQLAELGHVCRSRISQILNLLNLAPDIQEAILFLSPHRGPAPVVLRQLQPIASQLNWSRQRQLWSALIKLSKS